MDCDKYTFPLMKVDEIVEFINKLGFKVDKTIIESIDSDIIVELYCSILDKLGVIKKEKLKIRFDGISTFSFTGLHDRPIYILKLFKSIKTFITEVIGVENFCTNDLFAPNPKRTKRILSGIIKFFKFKQAEKDTVATIRENFDNSLFIFKESINKYDKTICNYNKIKELKDREKPFVNECEEQLNTLNLTQIDIETNLNEIDLKCKEKLKEQEESEDKIKNIDDLNESLSSKINLLKSQVVHSPEKMILLIEELKLSHDLLTNSIAEAEVTFKSNDKHVKILESIIKEVTKHENILIELETVTNKLLSVNKVIYEVTENNHKLEKTILEITSKIDNADKSLLCLNNYCEEFHIKHKKTIDLKDENLFQIKEKSSVLAKKLNELGEKFKTQSLQNLSIENKISDIDKLKMEFSIHFENEITNLLNLVLQYSTKMNKLLETNIK